MEHLFPYPKMGYSFLEILDDPLTRKILGFDAENAEKTPFISGTASRLKFLLNDPSKHLSFLKIGYTSLEAFLQANCTGPPLDFNPEEHIFPKTYRDDDLPKLKQELISSLSVDGTAVYRLAPHIELFWLAHLIMSNQTLGDSGFNGRRARLRVNFWHQKLLTERSEELHSIIYTDADVLEQQLSSRLTFGGAAAEEHFIEFLVERAQIRIYYGDDEKAREDLLRASKIRHFEFALSGALGKRTKFQLSDLSQLVVLARSRDHEPEPYSSRKSSRVEGMDSRKSSRDEAMRSPSHTPSLGTTQYQHSHQLHSPLQSPRHDYHVSPLTAANVKPNTIPLNDDTILEHIRFKEQGPYEPQPMTTTEESALPPRLGDIDPSTQPLLFPVDSIILLAIASSIQNTSPSDGLTREETLPYAARVLEGGSSNWQVYTQALLVRSRIEGYQSRTAERGLLQLQALVDQVISETSGSAPPDASTYNTTADTQQSTFLPKPNPAETASVAERLKYIYQLSPPLRWELESELAQRWTSAGGLKTALEIYERLQMNAETALCLAATDKEKEAIALLKSLLFIDPEADETELKVKPGISDDVPRLLCILGDIQSSSFYYDLAWKYSGATYSRAQRSLGRYYTRKQEYEKAAAAYTLALQRGQLDHSTWFALGCVQIELLDWQKATESFTRCVMLDDSDAQAWSNLAVSLLRIPVEDEIEDPTTPHNGLPSMDTIEEEAIEDEEDGPASVRKPDPYRHKKEALRALRRAATLKRDDARIWDNYLTVAASIPPSQGTPWAEIIQAMSRVIDLRGKKEGESCIDIKILSILVRYVTTTFAYPGNDGVTSEAKPITTESHEAADVGQAHENTNPEQNTLRRLAFIPQALVHLLDDQVVPLATSSPPLYIILAQVALWRNRPAECLAFEEKAWRATTAALGAYDTKEGWTDVSNATVDLIERYQELGGQERERTGGQVEPQWRFKARSAVRAVIGRGKDLWETTEDYQKLQEAFEGLKVDS